MIDKRGFTLIEMIVALLLISVLAFAVTYIFVEGFRSYVMNRNIIDLRSEARVALKRVVFEIRESENVQVTSPADFSINADIDEDGVLEEVRYYLDGTNLRRQVDGLPNPGNILLGNIDPAGTSISSPAVGSLVLNLTLSKANESLKIRTRVMARNI